jgi:hypothetical protein
MERAGLAAMPPLERAVADYLDTRARLLAEGHRG